MAWRNREEEKLERRQEEGRRESQGVGKEAGKEAGEKQKRSWKEIDAQRDGTRTRSGQPEGGRPKGESQAYRSYRSKLDRMFTGDVKVNTKGPDVAVVRKSESSMTAERIVVKDEAPEPLSGKEALKLAQDNDAIFAAAKQCLAEGGLPHDAEQMLKVLQLEDQTLLAKALDALLDACEKGRPKNARALIARLLQIKDTLTDPNAKDMALGLLARFGA